MNVAAPMFILPDEKQHAALQIAIAADVASLCPVHDNIILKGKNDIDEAYKLGNAKFNAGELHIFDDRREMMDVIKTVVDNHADVECYLCARDRHY